MKKVISFSLWGNNYRYLGGALQNVELAKYFYPDWVCRFYIGQSTRKDFVEKLRSFDNVEVVEMPEEGNWTGMLWRFYAASDPDVSVMMSRDCDSRIHRREVEAVKEWLNSDKDFHIMRDHPYHTVPILGGMWGCRNGILRNVNFSQTIEKWNQFHRKGIDQDFLGQVIYPFVKDKSLEHSEFNLKFGQEIRPFPTKRIDYEFVGEIFDENDVRHSDHWKLIKNIIG